MDFDGETVRQILLSVTAVGAFIILIVEIGVAFPGEAFGSTGGLALVGAIVLFVLVMAGIGVYLNRQ